MRLIGTQEKRALTQIKDILLLRDTVSLIPWLSKIKMTLDQLEHRKALHRNILKLIIILFVIELLKEIQI